MSTVGIDFGLSQSCIAVARNRGIDIVCNEVSNRFTPSLVSFGQKNRFLGEAAATVQLSNLPNTVAIKRLLGRPFDDPTLAKEREYLTVELAPTTHEVGVKVDFAGESHTFSATQIAAMFLAKLKQTAEQDIKGSVVDVVVSVPGWFAEPQRKAVLEACDIAGLNCLRLINDTTAAALAYGITKTDLPEEQPRHVVFIDIGLSSTSVAVVAFVKGKLQVKGTAYNSFSGGRDLDQLLVNHFVKEFREKYGFDVSANPKALHRLRVTIEKLKKVLSANSQAPLSIEALLDDRDVSSMITRSDFEGYAKPFLQSIPPLIDEALSKAGVNKDEVFCVETVGGTTRVPAVRDAIIQYFGRELLSFTINQDEAVARGATLMCAIISPTFRVRDFDIKDLAPYGVKLTWTPSQTNAATPMAVGDDVDEMDVTSSTADTANVNELVVFHQASTMPSAKVLTFYRRDETFDIEARIDSTTPTPVNVRQWLGRYTVKGIPKAKDATDVTTVRVKVKVNANGMLQLDSAHRLEEDTSAAVVDNAAAKVDNKDKNANGTETKEVNKKKYKRIELSVVQGSFGLSKEEVNKFRELEGTMASSDKLVFDTEVAKNGLEEYIYEARSKMEGDWSTFIADDQRSSFSELLTSSEDWLYSDEGEEAAKSVYVGKLAELKKIGVPAYERFRESEDRPRMERMFRDRMMWMMNQVNIANSSITIGEDGKYSHIPSSELKSVHDKLVEKATNLDALIKQQSTLPTYAPPVVTSQQLRKELEQLESFVMPILNRPKPIPKKEEPPVEKVNGTTNNANGTDGAQEQPKTQDDVTMSMD